MKSIVYYRLVLLTVLYFSMAGCERKINLDIDKNVPVLVVDGLITNSPPPYFVRLSTTTDLSAEENGIMVNNAIVRISNDLGEEEVLTRSADGEFRCDQLQGEIGRTYFLEIQWNDQSYVSQSTLLPVGRIDSLDFRFKADDLINDEGYYITYYGQKSDPSKINFYRWILTWNGQPLNNRFNLFIESDEFVNGLQGIEFDIGFQKNDSIGVEVYSLDDVVYNYYEAFASLVNNDGGIFSLSPDNPPSNLSNGAFGIFQASAVNKQSIVIK